MKILSHRQVRGVTNRIVTSLADYLRSRDIHNLVLGFSGGPNSAVVGILGLKTVDWLTNRGWPCNYTYAHFVYDGDDSEDLKKATIIANENSFVLSKQRMTEIYHRLATRRSTVEEAPYVELANRRLKTNLNRLLLDDLATMRQGVVLDTGNLTQLSLGLRLGLRDGGDVKVIQSMTQTEVLDLAEYLGVSQISKESVLSSMSSIKTDYIMSRLAQSGLNLALGESQLDGGGLLSEIHLIAHEVSQTPEAVRRLATQVLAAASIKHGDVPNLLPSRLKLGLARFGTNSFSGPYLAAMKVAQSLQK